ncbi:alpha/beta hydrolase [Moraxella cuniculi]|uniref:Predicted hydrolase of the alpha/beta-hydrolase fold n=1 Tax=Moraxella cuniculi TaxID=34061 RepID=A0A448GXL5_9GAMM|nr:alpha/beta fold hydrolase [Moraxella cuniculi]VEG13584.1 Predicted hydrolase of the alpha/beta-hydrolase fold [Moraxella cuniculi]
MATKQQITLIDAPSGVLEVDSIWQGGQRCASDALAVICHPNPTQGGTMNNKVVSTMYRFCRDAGMDTIRFNFRGVGRSTGSVGTGMGELDDAMTVLRYALSCTPARKLWLGGFSFGGYIACQLASAITASDEFNDVVLHNLALVAPSIMRQGMQTTQWQANRSFVIYGDQDELVSPASLAKFVQDRQLPHTVLTTGHFFHGKLVELRDALQQHTLP